MPIPDGNPQVEKNPDIYKDGHVDIAHPIAQEWGKYRLSGEEWQVLWIIIEKTWGWHKAWENISLKQFYEATGMKKPSIIRALKKLINKNIVSKKANGKLTNYHINSHYSTWKPLAKRLMLAKELMGVSKKANGISKKANEKNQNLTLNDNLEAPKETSLKETSTKESNTYIRILNSWNSLEIIEHKDTDKLRRKITAALKIYTPEELEDAFKNYAYILAQPDRFYWTYKWQLKDFLDRGIERFLPINFKEKDYLKRVYKSKAELEEERSMGILSRVFREEEEKDERNKV